MFGSVEDTLQIEVYTKTQLYPKHVQPAPLSHVVQKNGRIQQQITCKQFKVTNPINESKS